MSFYSEMTENYEDIFPLAEKKIEWLTALAKEAHVSKLLDIGCASGALAYRMAEEVNQVDAFDLEGAMIDKAAKAYQKLNLRYRQGDMTESHKVFDGEIYDMVTCFGNTLVHLQADGLRTAFASMTKGLKSGGMLVAQILNYDQILEEHLPSLPLIDNDRIRFVRDYLWEGDDLTFKTCLEIKASGNVYDNAVPLYPIRRQTLIELLMDAGFEEPIFYKNYNGEPAEGRHLPLIFTTMKNKHQPVD